MNSEEYLIESYIPELVKRRFFVDENDDREYVIKKCQVLPVTTDGTFMMNQCRKVVLELKQVKNPKIILKLDLVIKLSCKDIGSEHAFEIFVRRSFETEIFVYTKILPQFKDFGYYPKYYYGHVGEKDCSMVLGHFGVDGWQMAPTLVNLSLEHVLVTVKYLGKFHGNCYAMKELEKEKFNNIISKLGKSRHEEEFVEDPSFDEYGKRSPWRGVKAVKNSVDYQITEDELQELESLFADPSATRRDLVKPLEPLAILCHGDFLRNNLAYKYEGETPIDVMMFDFQTMCYSSPMLDLVTFMANSTGKDVREPNFEDIFKAYHEEMVKVLSEKLKCDPETLPEHFSYMSFLKEYLRLFPFGYLIASIFIHILHEPMKDFITFMQDPSRTEEILTRGGDIVDRELGSLVAHYCHLKRMLK